MRKVDAVRDESALQTDEALVRRKLDLGYFTEPGRCPLMVRRGARGAFELFLFLAHRYLESGGEPVVAEHEALCGACGLRPGDSHSRSAVSRLLRSLRVTYRVIDYQPIQRRRPRIRLAPARPDADALNPRQYVYFDEGWGADRRAAFDALGSRAFAGEYMYFVSKYESALARTKHARPYWFFPQEKISETYHVSPQFAGTGLRGLVELGVLRVTYGQYGLKAPNNEFGAANRYYFEGLGEIARRRQELADVARNHAKEYDVACALAMELTNGRTVKNVEGLAELIAALGEAAVREAVGRVAVLPPRSLRRRLAYVRALALGQKEGG